MASFASRSLRTLGNAGRALAPFVAAALMTGCIAEIDPDGTELEDAELALAAAPAGEPPREPGSCSVLYRSDIVIDADQATVWDVLVDMPRYAEWNPWIVYARGEAVPGAEVPVGVVLNGKVLDMKYVIGVVEPEQRFCTRDAAWFSTFIYGQRCRMLETLSDGTVHVWQELLIDGPFSQLADLTFGRTTRAGMDAEMAALRQRAEQL
jgi:hypothetical protein